jgi:predicted permease
MARDLLWALRWLRKNPLFTAAVTAILALGIGANTAVFSIADAVLLRPLPYASGRLVRIDETSATRPVSGVPAADYLRWRGRADLFEKTIAYTKDIVTLTGGAEPDQVMALRASGALFPLLGSHARLGRALTAADDDPASPNAAILSDRLWRRLFHADPGVLGRPIHVSDEVFTVAGVMPPDFEFQYSNVELWLPLRLTPATPGLLQIAAVTKPGITLPALQNALRITAARMERDDPRKWSGLRIQASPWSEAPDRKYELTLVFILAAVGLVLLIACADVGGLLLSRAVQRQKEIAICASLGAGFWRVARQLLSESFALAVLASAAGIAAAHFALRFLSQQLAALPIMLPHLQRVALNGRVLLFNAALCLLLACLCSLAPVLSASKTDLQAELRGVRSGAGHGPARLFAILIAAETAFAFLLLVGSGLMIHSLIRLQQEDHGFHPDHVLTMRAPVGSLTHPQPAGKYDTKPQQMAYYQAIIERLQKVPGIRAVAVVNNLPLSGVSTTTSLQGPDGKPSLNSTRTISPQYFAAMGIPLIAGRAFTDKDQLNAPGVAIINEHLAHQLFPNQNPIGRTLPSAAPNAPPVTVVGIVKDSTQLSFDQPIQSEVYRPCQQFIFAAFMSTIVARTWGDPLAGAAALRKEIWAVDPNQPVVKIETMNDVIADSLWRPRFSAWIFSVLGGLALLLTSAGVYSVVAYTSALRTREIGIRMALGAAPRNVIAIILRGAMIPLICGLAISAAAALALSRLLTSLLYEVSPGDAPTYLAAAALLLGIGAIASARPAWKAAAGDPLQALRSE